MTSPYDLTAARRGARTPKPSADRMAIDALRGVLRQIADTANAAIDSADKYSQRTLRDIEMLAARALAATEATTCATNHFDIAEGTCPRCGKVVQRDHLGREIDAPKNVIKSQPSEER